MKTKEEIEQTFENHPYWAYRQGIDDGVQQCWDAFRANAAKDLLPLATQMKDYRGFPEQCVSLAIQLADELIKQLREGK